MEIPKRWEKIEAKGEVYTPRTGYFQYVSLTVFPYKAYSS